MYSKYYQYLNIPKYLQISQIFTHILNMKKLINIHKYNNDLHLKEIFGNVYNIYYCYIFTNTHKHSQIFTNITTFHKYYTISQILQKFINITNIHKYSRY